MATVLRTLLWLTLGGWVGSWLLFAAAVAPLAFRVLPTPEMAGGLVSPLLADLHLYGACAGGLASILAVTLRRRRLLVVLPLVLAVVCLFSQFGISAEIATVRPFAFGPEPLPDAAARFAQLHALSRGLYGGVGLGVIVLIALHSHADGNH